METNPSCDYTLVVCISESNLEVGLQCKPARESERVRDSLHLVLVRWICSIDDFPLRHENAQPQRTMKQASVIRACGLEGAMSDAPLIHFVVRQV